MIIQLEKPNYYQGDLFIEKKEDCEKVLLEAKKRNFTRRIQHLFGELDKIQKEIDAFELK